MRLCMLDDLLAGARRLAVEAPEQRLVLAQRLIYEAHAAHHFAKRFHRPHPRWGNGSLMARAMADCPMPPRPMSFHALSVISAVVDAFQQRNAQAKRAGCHPARTCAILAQSAGDNHGRNQSKTQHR